MRPMLSVLPLMRPDLRPTFVARRLMFHGCRKKDRHKSYLLVMCRQPSPMVTPTTCSIRRAHVSWKPMLEPILLKMKRNGKKKKKINIIDISCPPVARRRIGKNQIAAFSVTLSISVVFFFIFIYFYFSINLRPSILSTK